MSTQNSTSAAFLKGNPIMKAASPSTFTTNHNDFNTPWVEDICIFNVVSSSNILPIILPLPTTITNDVVTSWVTDSCSHENGIVAVEKNQNIIVGGGSSPSTTTLNDLFPSNFRDLFKSYSMLLPGGLPKSHPDVINFPAFENYLNSLLPRFQPGGVEESAALAAANFCWKDHSDVVSILNSTSSIEDLLASVQQQSFSDQSRFTMKSALYFPCDPKFDLLCRLGCEGAIIDVDPDFKNQPIPQKYRKLEKQLKNVFATHAVKAVRAKRGLILRTDSIPPFGSQRTVLAWIGLDRLFGSSYYSQFSFFQGGLPHFV
jgi:hypothetical protein